MSKNQNDIEISDIVIVGNNTSNSKGEFDLHSYNEEDQTVDEKNAEKFAATEQKRLYDSIENLINDAATQHKQQYCNKNGSLLNENSNKITRLVTNEFFFYTYRPLTIKEFENLQQKINTLASKQPENLHLVLSSFAVLTSDEKKTMNVVVHIECGKKPKFNLIVKSNPSQIDPKYYDKKHFSKNDSFDKKDHIKINNKEHSFSLNNVITCETFGRQSFFSCIDICLDHNPDPEIGVARENLNKKIQSLKNYEDCKSFPKKISHILTSNSIRKNDKNCLGNLTQADPEFQPKNEKYFKDKQHYIHKYYFVSFSYLDEKRVLPEEVYLGLKNNKLTYITMSPTGKVVSGELSFSLDESKEIADKVDRKVKLDEKLESKIIDQILKNGHISSKIKFGSSCNKFSLNPKICSNIPWQKVGCPNESMLNTSNRNNRYNCIKNAIAIGGNDILNNFKTVNYKRDIGTRIRDALSGFPKNLNYLFKNPERTLKEIIEISYNKTVQMSLYQDVLPTQSKIEDDNRSKIVNKTKDKTNNPNNSIPKITFSFNEYKNNSQKKSTAINNKKTKNKKKLGPKSKN